MKLPSTAAVASICTLLIGLAASWLGATKAEDAQHQQRQAHFERLSQQVHDEIEHRLLRPLHALNGLVGLYAQTEAVSADNFQRYVDALEVDRQYPGVRGFAHVSRVHRHDQNTFEQLQSRQFAQGFKIKSQSPHDDLFVIDRIEPMYRNKGALGLDIGQEERRRTALRQAIDTGLPTSSARIILVQDQSRRPGILIFQPYYATQRAATSPKERNLLLRGVVDTAIVLADVLGSVQQVTDAKLDFFLVEPGNGNREAETLYSHELDTQFKPTSHTLEKLVPFPFAQRTWELRTRTNAAFEKDHAFQSAHLVGAGGSLLSILLSIVLWLALTGRQRAEQVATKMNQDLSKLAQVMKMTSHAAILMDKDMRIEWVNEGFTQLYGYSLEEASGQTMGHLVGTDATPPDVIACILDSCAKRVPCKVEVFNRNKFGHVLCIQTEIQPLLNAQGELLGLIELAQDLTELKEASRRMENALRESEAFMQTIHTHAIVSVTNKRGDITDVNDAFCRISGYHRDDLLGQNHRIINSGYHDKLFWKEVWQTISQGHPWRGDIANRAKDGSIYWVDSMITPIRNASGHIEKYVSIRTDITAKKRAEEQLRTSKSFLDRANHIARVGGWSWDMKAQQIYWTDGNCHIYEQPIGYAPDVHAPLNHVHPDDRPALTQAIDKATADGTPWDLELKCVTAKGRQIWVRNVGMAEMENGRVVRLVGATQDITQQREARLAQAQTTSLLISVLDAASEVCILAIDLNQVVTVFNTGATRMLGYQADEVIGQLSLMDFHDPGEIAEQAAIMSKALDKEVPTDMVLTCPTVLGQAREWTMIRKDGSRLSVSQVITPQRAADGTIIGYLSISHDITQRLAHEQALHQAMLGAEQANQAKSQFLANMSHEIRTPMNAILGMLRLLKRTPLSNRQKDYATKTEGAAQSLLSLLNDILDFSKIEAGKMTLDLAPFSVDQLMRNLAVILSASVEAKPVEILFDIDPTIPDTLIGDALRLQQILINLGGNAIKFTHQGQVVISIRSRSLSSATAALQVAVEDSGIGIQPAAQARLFQPFTQAEAATTRQFGGTGLGLTICQRLVHLMGGHIQVSSELGRGSRFSFDITLGVANEGEKQLPQSTRAPQGSQSDLSALRVLVVDDNPLARDVLKTQTMSLGWDCDLATSGDDALRQIATAETTNRPYDAIFMDWRMPNFDGWHTTARIRALDHPHRNTLVVMISATDREQVASRPLHEQAMLDAYLVKPVTSRMLYETIEELRLDHKPTSSAPRVQTQTRHRRLEGQRLLLVEDNANNQQIAKELLLEEGASIQIAEHGQRCIDLLDETPSAFDLILMDLQMPVMDGYTATRQIKAKWGTNHPPIVAMTANVQDDDKRNCIAAGMVSHVGKPFDLEELIACIQTHSARPSTIGHETTAPPPKQPPISAVLRDQARAHDIHMDAALERMGGRLDVYHRLAQSYLIELEAAHTKIRSSTESGDATVLEHCLHTIKGLSATMGDDQLSAVMYAAELSVQSGHQEATDAWMNPIFKALTDARTRFVGLMPSIEQELPAQADSVQSVQAGDFERDMQELIGALDQFDMRAVDLFDSVRAKHREALEDHLDELTRAMNALDFASASHSCQNILHLATT